MSETIDAVGRFLEAVRTASIGTCDVWADDVRLDATVPNWRFHRAGADAVKAEYGGWFAEPGEFESLRRLPVDGGEVIEYTLVWTEAGVPHAAHHAHLLELDAGRITADTVLCGGRWPASLLAEMAAADA